VTVKPVANSTGPLGRFIPTPQRLEYSELPIGWLLRVALQKPDYQMIGAPGWIDTDRYTIMAKAPEGTPQAALTTLLVNLLKDRFQLATHLETRELPMFNLVMARTDGRLGSDLKATPAECQATIAETMGRRKRPPPDVAPRRRFRPFPVSTGRCRAALAVSLPAMWPPAVEPLRSSCRSCRIGSVAR
jgi:uncharacterized protein (TIGR03435 family)